MCLHRYHLHRLCAMKFGIEDVGDILLGFMPTLVDKRLYYMSSLTSLCLIILSHTDSSVFYRYLYITRIFGSDLFSSAAFTKHQVHKQKAGKLLEVITKKKKNLNTVKAKKVPVMRSS